MRQLLIDVCIIIFNLCQDKFLPCRNSVNRRAAVGQGVESGRVGGQIIERGWVEVFTGIFALCFRPELEGNGRGDNTFS